MLVIIVSVVITMMAFTYWFTVTRLRKDFEQDAAAVRRFYQKQIDDFIHRDDWLEFEKEMPIKVGFYLVLAEGVQHYQNRVHKAIYSAFYKNFINENGVIVPYKVTHWKHIPDKPKHKVGA